ncbi:hypothetical protein CPC08DRAFT_730959 [Agrocybe pediades]|nr:hypothetical protein CPC08DRAFT_730959 [Agrocybe pediades]
MPTPWTTKEQLAWLNLRKSDYIEAQKTGRSTTFLTLLKEQWFVEFPAFQECFPEKQPNEKLTEKEEKKLGNHITKRKKQIDRWYPWHTIGHKTPRGSNIAGYMKILRNQSKKRERAPQEIEVYMKLYPEKVSAAYEAGPNKFRKGVDVANAKRSIARKLLEEESAEVKEEVQAEVDSERARIHEELKAELDEELCKSATPEEFQRAIDEVPSFLDAAMQAVVDSTGYEVFVMIGGPVPENKGHLSIEHYHYGPHTPAGANLSQSCVNFKDITDAFTKHVFKCFRLTYTIAEHVRAARALVLHEDEQPEVSSVPEKGETSKETEIMANNSSSGGKEADDNDMERSEGAEVAEPDGSDTPHDVFQDLIPMPRQDTAEPPDVNRSTLQTNSTNVSKSDIAVGAQANNAHQMPPLRIPPSDGGPTEPYEYAFTRMASSQAPHILDTSDRQGISDSNIDPIILAIGRGVEQQQPAGVTGIQGVDYVVARPANRELGQVDERHGDERAAIGDTQEGGIQSTVGLAVAGHRREDLGMQRESREGGLASKEGAKTKKAQGPKSTKKVPAKESQSQNGSATCNSADQGETIATGRQRRSIRPPVRPDGEPMSPLIKPPKRKNGKENNEGEEGGKRKCSRK